MYPDDGEDSDTLINRADAAMYLAKRYEDGGIVFHGGKPRIERNLQPPTLDSLRQRLVYYERAMAEHERRLAQLQEANEQLVLAALGVQELQVAQRTRHCAVVAVVGATALAVRATPRRPPTPARS